MSCLDCGLASKAVEHAGLFLLPKITGIRFHPGNVSQSRFASASEESRLAGDETVWDPSQQTTPFKSGHNTKGWCHSSTHRHAISTDLWVSLISRLKIIQETSQQQQKKQRTDMMHSGVMRSQSICSDINSHFDKIRSYLAVTLESDHSTISH